MLSLDDVTLLSVTGGESYLGPTIVSMIKMGYVSYSTFTANMVYLGEWGEHSRPENYRDSWSDQLVYQQEVGNHIINDSVKSQVKKYLSERYLV